jgi:DNA-binding protein YbaB
MDFGSLFGNMQERLQQVKKDLENARLEAEAGEGKVKVTVSGSKKLLTVHVADELAQVDRKEELEDLLIVAVNRAFDKADAEAAKVMHDVTGGLPPGMLGV